MKYKEAIKKIPSASIVSIGCSEGAGWFYFTKSEDLKIETEIIFRIIDEKMKKKLNQIRYNMRNEKYLNAVSLNGYLRDWNKLISMQKKYGEFNTIELLNCECTIIHKIDGSYGILLTRWNISGNYWNKEEWEEEHGKI